VGVGSGGPSDAAVVHPVPGSARALAIGNGLATGWCADPYAMTLAAIDECVRNLVCVGADPARIAILDNFCWPSCDEPRNMGALVRAAEACLDGALAYRTPFISGKDSLKNQFRTQDGRTIMIPPTLLVSGFGIVADAGHACTMDLKSAGNLLVLVGQTGARMGGSHRAMLGACAHADLRLPEVDPALGARTARAVAACAARTTRAKAGCFRRWPRCAWPEGWAHTSTCRSWRFRRATWATSAGRSPRIRTATCLRWILRGSRWCRPIWTASRTR
jgi:phosphoribosylformylglycinamidine synthase